MLDGLGFLANLLEWALSSYFDAFEALEQDLEEIDAKAMSGTASVTDDVLSALVEMRREVGRLRRALVSHREVVLALTRPELEAIASSDSAERFSTLRDRLEEAVQASRDTRESIVGSFDVLLASTGQRTNEIMKVLTLASVLLLPGALIAGVMGMNFEVGIFETAALLLGGPRDHRGGRRRDARGCKGARVDLTEYRVEPPAEGRPPEPPVRVALSPKSILVWVAVTAGAILALMFVYLALDAITWVLVAAFFAMALNPAVGALERRGVGRGRAAAIVFVVAFAALGLLGLLVIPPLVTATTDFVEALPDHLRDLDAERGPLAFLEERFHLGEQLVDIYERGGIAGLLGLESPGASTARAAADTALALIAVPFLTFFMLLDGRRWVDGVLDVMPPSARPRWERVFDGINRTIGGYVTGNLLISLVAGTVAAVTLMAAGVPYALPLAVIVAILDLVPLVGATVALVVCSVAALSEGVVQAVIVVGRPARLPADRESRPAAGRLREDGRPVPARGARRAPHRSGDRRRPRRARRDSRRGLDLGGRE